jgi:hypothetical protein
MFPGALPKAVVDKARSKTNKAVNLCAMPLFLQTVPWMSRLLSRASCEPTYPRDCGSFVAKLQPEAVMVGESNRFDAGLQRLQALDENPARLERQVEKGGSG